MQAKLLIFFVLVAGSIVSCTGNYPIPAQPVGRKREVHLYFVLQLHSPVVFSYFRDVPEQECLLYLVQHNARFD